MVYAYEAFIGMGIRICIRCGMHVFILFRVNIKSLVTGTGNKHAGIGMGSSCLCD